MVYTDLLTYAALIAEIVALPFLAWQILMGRRESQRSRDLDIILSLSQSFRERWEEAWEDALLNLQTTTANQPVPYKNRKEMSEDERELMRMLNWIDWVGTALRTKMLSNKAVLLDSLGPTFVAIMNLGRSIIEEEVSIHGCQYWGSLLHVGRQLNLAWADDLIRKRNC